MMAGAQVTISTTALPAGNTNNAYTATLVAANGTAPYTWTLTGGTLPAGLSLSSTTGVISGLPTTLTSGTPPVPTQFTVQVADQAQNTATQTYSITILAPGSHSLVINQFFTGGGAGSTGTPSPYASDYLEIFNAGPVAVDLQNWTLQFGSSGSAFAASGVVPIGSLDPYQVGSTGGPNNDGNFPAFPITYSNAFSTSNCNPASTSAQVNTAFPASHCWLLPGQYMLVLTAGPGGGTNTSATTISIPLIPADLVLGTSSCGTTTCNPATTTTTTNSGPVSSTSATNTGYVGHGGSAVKPGAGGGMIALVNGVGIGVTCQAVPPGNPNPPAVFSPLASDFVAFFDQVTAGTTPLNTCWNGSSFPVGGSSTAYTGFTVMGGAIHVEGSGKNSNALIRAKGQGKLNATSQNSKTYPSGVILANSGVTFTPCGDTANNFTDFAPIKNGPAGQTNWVLHNSSTSTNPTIEAGTGSPQAYTSTACTNLNTVGPTATATFSNPNVGQGSGNVTETLTVKVTPSSKPTSTLFNVHADLSGIAGASSTAPLTASSVGVPDSNGNLVYQEQFTIPTTNLGTLTVPIAITDDAYRVTSLNPAPTITVSAVCQAPVANNQSPLMNWNGSQSVVLTGQVGANCNSGDTLVYAIKSQPLRGTLSAISGNSVTYTPNSGFSGMDSFTFNVTDTTNSAGPLTSATATVNVTVNGTGTPAISLSCPTAAVVYTALPQGCTASLNPFVAGTTTITYNGSASVPSAVGTYAVIASFVSNSDQTQNTSATGSLVINQATPTLTLGCPTVAWDGSPLGCAAATIAGIGGYTPTGTISLTYNGSSTSPTNPGTYPVFASFASSDPNYTSTTANSSLTISEPLITITVNNQTIVYGSSLPTFTYTVTPSIPLQTAPVCTSSATGASAVGTYAGAITCSGAAKIGCTFVYVPGNMTVQIAAATVTANSLAMNAGGVVPPLTYATTPSGITFTTAPVCTTTATSISPIGTYPITCSGGVAPNYTLSYVAGTMTVGYPGMPAIVNISPMTTTAGSPNLVLTVNGSGFVSGATVLWNGAARVTTFVSPTQLTATIVAADLTTVGSAEVVVSNPAPGGSSASQTFSIDSAPVATGGFTVTPSTPVVTVTHGQSTTTYLTYSTLQPGAVVSAVCYNLPTSGYCSYNNGTLTIGTGVNTAAGNYQVLVVCSTSGVLSSSSKSANTTLLCGLLGFPIGLLMLYRGRRFRLYGLSVLSIVVLMVGIGCGGNSMTLKSPVNTAQVSTTITLNVQ